MSWVDELLVIRRFLRDPSATIWTDAFLRHIYNDVQQDFQHKTNFLLDVAVQRVPGVYQFSYQYEWEFAHLPSDESQFYQCLIQHDTCVICHRWEVQQIAGIPADVSDYGDHFTQSWEAYMCTPGEAVRMRFPRNFNQMTFIAHDEEPISALSLKSIQSADPSYMTNTGTVSGYYITGEVDNSYALYPRPASGFTDELSGEGAAFALSDDTEDATAGIIAVREGSFDPDDGMPVDLIGTVNNVFMIYEASPTDMQSAGDESDFPDFILKYVRFGVISRAYGGNNDGKIKSLSEYWQRKYDFGIKVVKQYMSSRKSDRDYRLSTKGVTARRNVRHPRLPDGYPATP